ncbi:hypothetical protein [Caballeronia sp. LZ043]|uniref:hypothetical protein n=1 Tax=Caballeronia sp. LZ043 TaxID=3038569 RepID=UPI002856EB8E|nr:hypothetical protein [Caballeronia sp. LZ043]MDR5821753.1 hypothetical protein [Caballeronia sp. LZ043]
MYIKNALQRYLRMTTIPTVKDNGPWTVFYSWQSTLPNSTNRGLVLTCIDKAVETLNAEMNVEDSLRVDSDTNGRPGSPKIFDTILEKIKQCDVFIADVSLVAERQANSNVMVELGYALNALGPDRIVMVCNTAFGSIGDLPFDLGFNRVIPYSCTREEKDKAAVRAALVSKLKAAIDGICRPVKSISHMLQSACRAQENRISRQQCCGMELDMFRIGMARPMAFKRPLLGQTNVPNGSEVTPALVINDEV